SGRRLDGRLGSFQHSEMSSSLWKTAPVEPAYRPAGRQAREHRGTPDNWLQSGRIEGRPQVPSRMWPAAAPVRGGVHKNTHIGKSHLAHHYESHLCPTLLA